MSNSGCSCPDSPILRAVDLELWLLPEVGSVFLLRRKADSPPRSLSLPLCTSCIVGYSHMLPEKAPGNGEIISISSFLYLSLREKRTSTFQRPHCLSTHISAFEEPQQTPTEFIISLTCSYMWFLLGHCSHWWEAAPYTSSWLLKWTPPSPSPGLSPILALNQSLNFVLSSSVMANSLYPH